MRPLRGQAGPHAFSSPTLAELYLRSCRYHGEGTVCTEPVRMKRLFVLCDGT